MAHERVLAAVRPTGPSCNGCTFPYGSIVKGGRVLVISLRLPLTDFIGSMRPVSDRIQVTSKTAPTTWGKGKRRRQRKGRAGMFAGWADRPSTKSGTSTSHSSPGRRTTPHHHGRGRDHGPSVHLMSGEWMMSRRACFMPSLGRFKEIFWNQDSLTRQGGTTTWGPRIFRIQAPLPPFPCPSPGCSPDAGSIFRLSQMQPRYFPQTFRAPGSCAKPGHHQWSS